MTSWGPQRDGREASENRSYWHWKQTPNTYNVELHTKSCRTGHRYIPKRTHSLFWLQWRGKKSTYWWKRFKKVGKVKSTNAARKCAISFLICLKTCWRAMTSRHSKKEEAHRSHRVNSQMFSPLYTGGAQEKHCNWGEVWQNAKEWLGVMSSLPCVIALLSFYVWENAQHGCPMLFLL